MVFDHTVEFCPRVKRDSLQVPFKALREINKKKKEEEEDESKYGSMIMLWYDR